MAGYLVAAHDGVLVTVKVTPRARREGIEPPGPDGALRVKVTAPPEDGRANAAVIAALARHWHLPKSRLEIAAGGGGRLKRVLVRGNAAALLRQLEPARTAP